MRLPYFIQYALCCTFIGVVFGVLDALLGSEPKTATQVLIIGLALMWSLDKERGRGEQ